MSEDCSEIMFSTLGFLNRIIVEFLVQISPLKLAWSILSNYFKNDKFPFGPSVLEQHSKF